MITSCVNCEKKNTCQELCPEAEKFVNQDAPNYHKPGELHFTPIEKEIVTLLMQGKNRRQIRNRLHLSPVALRMHIKRLRKKRNTIVL